MYRLNEKIFLLALPLIASNLTVPLLGISNTFVMGHMGNAYYIGAMGIGALIFDYLYWSFGFLRMGTTGLVANAYGANDYNKMAELVVDSLFFALIAGILLVTVKEPIAKIAFWLLGDGGKITEHAKAYYHIRILGAPAALINYVILGTFIGMQDTKRPLLLMIILNLSATLLGLYLVWHRGFGVAGIAAADVVAQYAAMAIGLALLHKKVRLPVWRLPSWTSMRRLLVINNAIFIRTLCLITAFSFFTYRSMLMGEPVLAANTVLLEFLVLMAYAQDGFANVAEALIGHAVGARNTDEAQQAFKDTLVWALYIASLFVILYAVFGTSLIHFMTNLPGVRIIATYYLPFAIIMPLVAAMCYFFDGVFIGANRFSDMRNTMMVSLAGYLILWELLRSQGNTGLWAALLSFFALRGICMGLVFRQDKSFLGTSIEKPQIDGPATA